MNTRKILKAIAPYTDKIIYNKGHYKAYVKGRNNVITISSTPGDSYAYSMIYRDFKRLGIIIKALNKNR